MPDERNNEMASTVDKAGRQTVYILTILLIILSSLHD